MSECSIPPVTIQMKENLRETRSEEIRAKLSNSWFVMGKPMEIYVPRELEELIVTKRKMGKDGAHFTSHESHA